MAEPIAEPELPEAPAEPEVPVAAEPEVPIREPARLTVRQPLPEPETEFGETPLSAIERLAMPGDLSPRIHRRDRFLTAAWAASFAALAAIGVAGYTERDLLMQQWPASKRVYATLGLAPVDVPRGDVQRGDGQRGDGQRGDVQRGDGQRGDGQRGDVQAREQPATNGDRGDTTGVAGQGTTETPAR
jgi:transcription termination factor Rho